MYLRMTANLQDALYGKARQISISAKKASQRRIFHVPGESIFVRLFVEQLSSFEAVRSLKASNIVRLLSFRTFWLPKIWGLSIGFSFYFPAASQGQTYVEQMDD